MSWWHEVDRDGTVQAHLNSPGEVEQHPAVLVLTCTVVTVEMDRFLPQSIVREEVVHVADDGVAPFAAAHGLIHQEVDLLRQSLTVNSKDSAFGWRQEIQRSWLHRIAGVVNLLPKVKTVMEVRRERRRRQGQDPSVAFPSSRLLS